MLESDERRRHLTLAAKRTARSHRPLLVNAVIGLLIFLGVSAVAGGAALSLGRVGDGMVPPIEWLDGIPYIDSWLVPGLVLGIGFGLGSLLTVYGMLRRPTWRSARFVEDRTGHHWSWLATILLGSGQVAWIALELVYLPEPSVLQAVYGPLGLALFLLPFTSSVSGDLRLG